MKIGVVVDNDLNNDNRVLRELSILKEKGHEIFVICFGFNNRQYDPVNGIRVTRIKISRRIKDILFFFLNTVPAYGWLWTIRIHRFILNNNPDVLHVHDLYMSQPACSGIQRSGRKIPIVLDLHENYPFAVTTYNWTKGFLRNLLARPLAWKRKESALLKNARKIVVLSDEFREELLGRYDFLSAENFCVFPNVPDIKQMDEYKAAAGKAPLEKKAPVILYFGVVAERRGIFNALEAFREVLRKGTDATLLIIGPVDKRDRKRFFSFLSLPELKPSVTYIPWKGLHELPAFLEMSDICLAPFIKNPQHESGVANKIFDYMLGGRPIIASDCGPQKNLIEKYNCGIIFRDQKEFTASMIRLLADEDLRREMGKNGFNAVVSELNTTKKKESLIRMYDELEYGMREKTDIMQS
ncbi:MAG: glycosyltransferase family 4 protein [Bacteroidales bacterium]|nr:glycosyltransferase family 4 protein [Bacteroidales bacterium]